MKIRFFNLKQSNENKFHKFYKKKNKFLMRKKYDNFKKISKKLIIKTS